MSKLRDYLLENFVHEIEPFYPPETEVKYPVHIYHGENNNIIGNWFPVSEPFVMEPETFRHDFDQLLYFGGGDLTQIDVLGGVAEFHLGDEHGNLEKFTITKPTVFYVKAGVYHCPIKFLEIFDPKKPIFFNDITLAGIYRKFRMGSDEPLGVGSVPIEKTW